MQHCSQKGWRLNQPSTIDISEQVEKVWALTWLFPLWQSSVDLRLAQKNPSFTPLEQRLFMTGKSPRLTIGVSRFHP